MLQAEHFGVSILSAGQEQLARRFADQRSDRFEGVGFTRGKLGLALIDDALAHLECMVIDRHEDGDHTVVIAVSMRRDTEVPARLYRGGYTQIEQ